MENRVQMGMNRTGMAMSPRSTPEMLQNSKVTPSSLGDSTAAWAIREAYINDSDGIGSVPLPATFKGVAKTIVDKISGERPEILLDKLGERLAFERIGVRLYDLLINKCEAGGETTPDDMMEKLILTRDDELRHFRLVETAIRNVGGDPTAVTPGANVAGISALGLVQILADPRTSIADGLQALLIVELVDNAGWELLIELTEGMDLEELAIGFRTAKSQEERHLSQVRSWHSSMILKDATLGAIRALG